MTIAIKQRDLSKLLGTNAEVLTYLLEPRNRTYVLATDHSGRRLLEKQFLEQLKLRGIRVFIDAGAQILENDNVSLIKLWMQVDNEAPAAVFFNEQDKAMVYHRKGHSTPLLASPYADNLGKCLVYLDEAHTRGTDLKLPSTAKGALTLGPGQTKDHTVQGELNVTSFQTHYDANRYSAAMRLRQLGTTQSVVFFAPPEVHQSILDFQMKDTRAELGSSDVVAWLLDQTCKFIQSAKIVPRYSN